MITLRYNGNNKPYAQKLRRELTKQERRLWYEFLREYPIQFRRQKQFGNYIVDFFCAKAHLVVELDGSQHYEPQAENYDQKRTSYLEELGFRVLRFTNLDIDNNFRAVCEAIDYEARNRVQEFSDDVTMKR